MNYATYAERYSEESEIKRAACVNSKGLLGEIRIYKGDGRKKDEDA